MGNLRINFSLNQNELFTPKQLDAIWSMLMSEPFGKYQLMFLDIDNPIGKREPFASDKLFRNLFEKDQTCDYLYGKMGPDLNTDIEIFIKKENAESALFVLVDHDDFIENGEAERFYEMFISMARIMPSLSYGIIAPIEQNDCYRLNGIRSTVFPHTLFMGWINLLGPAVYNEYFTKEILLNAPAWKVEEWDNDVVFIQTYESAFEYGKPENIERAKVLSDYLDKTKKEIHQNK